MDERRAGPTNRLADPVRNEIGREVGDRDPEDDPGASPEECQSDRDGEPDGSPGPEVREPFEDGIEPAGPVKNDPPLDTVVEADQVGMSCFVESISCRGSNGLPMKPEAPRACASAADSSSTFPLNMITGMASTP